MCWHLASIHMSTYYSLRVKRLFELCCSSSFHNNAHFSSPETHHFMNISFHEHVISWRYHLIFMFYQIVWLFDCRFCVTVYVLFLISKRYKFLGFILFWPFCEALLFIIEHIENIFIGPLSFLWLWGFSLSLTMLSNT